MKIFKYLVLMIFVFIFVDIFRYFLLPNVSELEVKNPIPTAFMEFRQNEWKENNENKIISQKWVKLKEISPYVIKAVLISEDDKFWKHEGFDVDALESAFEKNLKNAKFSAGGSTITQQLSKNLYLSPTKNPIRKIKEAIITWRIEKSLSKKRIIEIYLNIAEWGDGIFGIEAAAQHYFKKSAKNLTALQAAKLAAVLPNPIIYNPIGDQKFVVTKSKRIFKIMQRRGIVVPEFKEIMTQVSTDFNQTNIDLKIFDTNHSTYEVNSSNELNQTR
jgi:monofunctional biosynthetic peptidoglycan transglycosylase